MTRSNTKETGKPHRLFHRESEHIVSVMGLKFCHDGLTREIEQGNPKVAISWCRKVESGQPELMI